MPLQWQTVHIPLAAGLQTKTDRRALDAPGMLTCKNAVFTETGGTQQRYPYTALSTSIVGGGTIADLRRVYAYGDELLLFSKDTLYTYSADDAAWVSRATYLAPKITEKPRFVRTQDQTRCERAEISGRVIYAWSDTATSDGIQVGMIDATTGAMLMSPTSAGADLTSPRMVVLTNRVLLFAYDKVNDDLLVKSLDPTSLAAGVAGAWTTVASTEFQVYFDVAKLTATTAVVVWRRTTTTSYGYATVTETPTVTASTKARACAGPIAVAVSPTGAHVAVIRNNTTAVTGDVLDSSLVDVATAAAVGTITTAALRIGACFRAVQNSGVYRCYVFWDNGAAQPSCETKSNYMDTAGAVGTEAAFVYNTHVISVFAYSTSVFAWVLGTPDSTEQRSYFLYRDDALLQAKACTATAGAGAPGFVTSTQSAGGSAYTFCGVQNNAVTVTSGGGYYGDGGPTDVTVEFDSNEARRVCQLGRTLFISGGQILQYDGEGLAELSFHTYPQLLLVSDAAAGLLAAASYNWRQTDAWQNAKGERDRSTTTKITTTAIAANRLAQFSIEPTTITMKRGSRSPISKEVWRTVGDAAVNSAFYMTTDVNPNQAATVNNGWIENSPTTLGYQSTTRRDNRVDSGLIVKEPDPEGGDVLESIAPAPGTILAANHERLFVAGIPGDPYAVWPSKTRQDDDLPAFHESMIVRLPAHGGDITALAFLNNTLIAFKESAIYALPGDGFDNFGSGQNFGPPQLLSGDVGAVSADVVATTPEGLIFLSSKGWHLLNRGWSTAYIGGAVEDYNTDTFSAVHVLESQHQIRCFSTSRVLVFDWVAKEWAEWELTGTHATIYNGVYHYCSSTGVFSEATALTTTGYSMDIRIAWAKLQGLLGFQRIRRVAILGEYVGAHDLEVSLYRDYSETAFQTKTWTVSPTTVGDGEIVRFGPSIQKMAAISIRIRDRAVGSSAVPVGGTLKLTGIAIEVGLMTGIKRLPAAQKI